MVGFSLTSVSKQSNTIDMVIQPHAWRLTLDTQDLLSASTAG